MRDPALARYDATGLLPRILERFAGRYGGNGVGAALVVVASFATAGMMVSVRELSETYTVWQILLIRSVGQVVLFVPLMVRTGGDILKSEQVHFQFLRVVLSFGAIAFLIYFYRSYALSNPFLRLAIALLLGGAIGNLIDRIRLGAVIDFVDVGPWPIFNIADSAITVGIAIIVIFSFITSWQEEQQKKQRESTPASSEE